MVSVWEHCFVFRSLIHDNYVLTFHLALCAGQHTTPRDCMVGLLQRYECIPCTYYGLWSSVEMLILSFVVLDNNWPDLSIFIFHLSDRITSWMIQMKQHGWNGTTTGKTVWTRRFFSFSVTTLHLTRCFSLFCTSFLDEEEELGVLVSSTKRGS
jgi:hypothetical protein